MLQDWESEAMRFLRNVTGLSGPGIWTCESGGDRYGLFGLFGNRLITISVYA